MASKSEKRAQREANKLERFEASKAATLAKVKNLDQPKIVVDVPDIAAPRVAPHLARAAAQAQQIPKTIVEGSRFSSRMTYCVTKKDHQGMWSWQELRAWTNEEWSKDIFPALTNFSKLTWGEIDRFSSDSGHKMHHTHDISQLHEEAQKRWIELDLEQFDTVFRFRMGNTERAWGYVVQAHFFMVWWDRHHSIYPV